MPKPRKRVINSNINDKLILRGFIHCPDCGHLLTGSGSKGQYAKYYYYHCFYCKHYRIRADKTNLLFEKELQKLNLDREYISLYKDALRNINKEMFSEEILTQKSVKQSVDAFIKRIFKAKELHVHGEICSEDYKIIKEGCEKRINMLGVELHRSVTVTRKNNINLKKAIDFFSNPGRLITKLDQDSPRGLLSILLKDGMVVTADARDIFNFPVQTIYGLNGENRNKEHHMRAWSKHSFTQYEYRDKVIAKTLKIEKEKGNSMVTANTYVIIDFLEEYARLIVNGLLRDILNFTLGKVRISFPISYSVE